MAITDYDKTAANNRELNGHNVPNFSLPAGPDDLVREIMADLAKVNDGTTALTRPVVGGVVSFETRSAAESGSTGTASFLVIGDLVYKYDASGTALTTGDSRTWSPVGIAYVNHFEANATPGTTDLTTPIKNALGYAGGAGVRVDETLAFSSRIGPSSSAPTVFEGSSQDGAALHRLSGGESAGSRYIFGSGQPIRVRNISLTAAADATSGSLFVLPNNSDVSLFNVTADLTGTNARIGELNNNNAENITLAHCDLTGLASGFLKSNTATGTHTCIRALFCNFNDFVATSFGINSPGGITEDVLVLGNSFRNTGSYAGAWASVRGSRVMGNYFDGGGIEAWRLEEECDSNVFLGNVAYCAGQNGFESIANSVGGTAASPRHTILGDWVFVGETGASGYAVSVPSNSDGSGTINSVFHDVIATGGNWDGVINTPGDGGLSLWHHFIAKDTTNGVRVSQPTLSVDEILCDDVTTPVATLDGGVIGTIHMRSEDNDVPPCPTTFASINTAPAGITRLTWETKLYTLGTGAFTYDIVPLGYLFDVDVVLIYSRDATRHQAQRGNLTWDGTTLTWTGSTSRGSGSVTFSSPPFINNAGNLALSGSNGTGSAQGSSRFQIDFKGLMLWS